MDGCEGLPAHESSLSWENLAGKPPVLNPYQLFERLCGGKKRKKKLAHSDANMTAEKTDHYRKLSSDPLGCSYLSFRRQNILAGHHVFSLFIIVALYSSVKGVRFIGMHICVDIGCDRGIIGLV